eukprot:gene16757-34829_t
MLLPYMPYLKTPKITQILKCIRSNNSSPLNGLYVLDQDYPNIILSIPKINNGLIESTIKQDMRTLRTLLLSARPKICIWNLALDYVSQTKCVLLAPGSHKETKTPFEKWRGYKPNISYLRPFGCPAYPIIPIELRLPHSAVLENPVASLG